MSKGVGFGAFIWGPCSEAFGRRIPLLSGFALLGLFQIPVALARNLATALPCRFFQGLLGSSSLAVVGGSLADIWIPAERGIPMTSFVTATLLGPITGPVIGGFISQSYLKWRWTSWISLIVVAFVEVLGFFSLPETFIPILQRRHTSNTIDPVKERIMLRDLVTKYILRPFQMIRDPIIFLLSLYLALVFGILFLFLGAYPVAFQELRGMGLGVGSLPFLGIAIGIALGGCIIAWANKFQAKRLLAQQKEMVPERRLPLMMAGAVSLPVGLFWFGWTGPPIHWFVQVLAGIPMGIGIILIFLQGISYIVGGLWTEKTHADRLEANVFAQMCTKSMQTLPSSSTSSYALSLPLHFRFSQRVCTILCFL